MTTKILTVGADASLQTAIAETLSPAPLLRPSNPSEHQGHGLTELGTEDISDEDRFELVFAPDASLETLRKVSSEPPQLIICHLEGCDSGTIRSSARRSETSRSGSGASQRVSQAIANDSVSTTEPCWPMLLNHWRQSAATAQVPIILLASSSNIPSARRGMELGADDYLLTPISPTVLLGAIQARLRRKANFESLQQQTQLLAQALKHELSALQNQLQDVQRAEALKSKLLKRAAQDLREPLANINMALHLLKGAGCEVERDRYISVLESECVRELSLLDDLSNVQTLLTPDNTSLLQKFQVLANS